MRELQQRFGPMREPYKDTPGVNDSRRVNGDIMSESVKRSRAHCKKEMLETCLARFNYIDVVFYYAKIIYIYILYGQLILTYT